VLLAIAALAAVTLRDRDVSPLGTIAIVSMPC
jgi:hypothetical protein